MRLGLHLHYADEGSREEQLARRYIERVRPPMIKVLNNAFNPSFLRFCREQGTEVVGRMLLDNEDQDWDTRPALRTIEAAVRANPDIGWWEFYNEYERIHDLDDMEKYAEICIEFMAMMEALGKHGLIGSFGTGSPEPEEWERFAPAVQHAWTHGHGLCLHEYSAPDMRYGCGANQWDDEHKTARLDDPCLDPAVLGNLTLRYRRVLAQFQDRIQAWGATPRIFLGETGNDDITMAPGGGGKGYRSWYGSEWLLGDYADQMRWYCWQLSHDPAIIGLVDFGWGTVAKEPDDDKWHSFDLAAPEEEQMLERLTELQLTLPREHVAPGATLTPPPAHRLPPWRPGDTVRPLHAVNFRREPGLTDKPADDVVRVVRKGAHLTVRPDLPRELDGLLWWSLAHGSGREGATGLDGRGRERRDPPPRTSPAGAAVRHRREDRQHHLAPPPCLAHAGLPERGAWRVRLPLPRPGPAPAAAGGTRRDAHGDRRPRGAGRPHLVAGALRRPADDEAQGRARDGDRGDGGHGVGGRDADGGGVVGAGVVHGGGYSTPSPSSPSVAAVGLLPQLASSIIATRHLGPTGERSRHEIDD